jgi:hypothetical protein
MKTLEERKNILDYEVSELIKKGWTIEHRTDTTCLLVKQNNLLGCLSILGSLLVLVPFVQMPIKTYSIEVSPEGEIIHH